MLHQGICYLQPRKNDILSVDARPSNAKNVANRCKAPIFVSRQIVLEDAIKIGYWMGRKRDTKSTYDVSLDSTADGPDILSDLLAFLCIYLNVKMFIMGFIYFDHYDICR
ncbi:hypothetical protein CFP56_015455 [Quercus suber]|uniref:BFN domain-containing protein n=1 Tax=Quercus suber TaxID=58331 RepID=A0AAW0KR19_QUESU